MMNLFILAVEAAPAVPAPAGDESWWKVVAVGALGAILMRVCMWAADFLSGSGGKKMVELLGKLQEKSNENSVLAQISADDAVINIVKASIPDVLAVVGDNVKKDLKDGKFTKADWEGFGEKLWEAAKPHVISGKNDYLAASSFNDGKAIAALVAKRFFTKKEEGGEQ